jgi:hypothetical protein
MAKHTFNHQAAANRSVQSDAFTHPNQTRSDGEQNMLKIQRSSNGHVVFTLSGQMEEEDLAELKALINAETGAGRIVLDLKNLIMVGRDTVAFLARCEADNITLKNCAAYVREWITRQRESS